LTDRKLPISGRRHIA